MPVEANAIPVQILRAQVSHTWLDHEILMLLPEEAVRRWRNNNWGRLRKEFGAYRQRAAALLERLEEYSGHLLFEGPEAEAELPPSVRERLRANTLQRWRAAVQFPVLRQDYADALDALCVALDQFETTVYAVDATEDAVARHWLAVREKAVGLKTLFSSERVPREVGGP